MSRTAYVIFRQVFDGARRLTDQDSRDPGRRVALGVYLELSAAEARLGQLMQRIRRTANPFAWHHRLTVDHVLGLSDCPIRGSHAACR